MFFFLFSNAICRNEDRFFVGAKYGNIILISWKCEFCIYSNLQFMKILLGYLDTVLERLGDGFDVNSKDDSGRTGLHYACEHGTYCK